MTLLANVCNEGALQVGAGIGVSFYDNTTQEGIACLNAPVVTMNPIQPGNCEVVACHWGSPPIAPDVAEVRVCVDNSGYDCDDVAGTPECYEDNNIDDNTGPGCIAVPD